MTFIFSTNGFEIDNHKSEIDLEPIYVKRTSPVKVLCRFRILEYNIELNDLPQIKHDLNNLMGLLKDTCEQSTFNKTCQFIINELNIWIKSFRNNYLLMESANIQSSHNFRKRRNTLDIISKTVKLSDYGYSDLKQSIEQLTKANQLLLSQQNQTINAIAQAEFSSLAFFVSQLVRRYTQIQDNILDVVINENPKAIVELISLDSLKAELLYAEPILRREFCEFPIEIKVINIMNLLKESKTVTTLTSNSLKISLHIPTFYRNEFVLNTGIPIPFNFKKSVYVVRPSAPYYLTYYDGKNNNTYGIAMSMEERNKCKPITGKLLCYPKVNYEIIQDSIDLAQNYLLNPMYDSCNKRKLKLLSGFNSIPNGCNVKRIGYSNRLIQLEEDKFYLHLIEPSNVKFDCSNNHSIFNISESILLEKIPRECSIQFDNGFHAEQSDVYLRTVFISSTVTQDYSISKNDFTRKPFIRNVTFKTFRNLQPEFAELHEQINNINIVTKTRISTSNNSMIQIVLPILIILALILTCAYVTFLYYKMKTNQIEIPSKSPSSMDTITPEPKRHFNFELKPFLPPKTRSKSSIPRSPNYDYPKTTNELIDETFAKFGSPSVVTVSEKSNVKYATIQKIKSQDPITQV